MERSAGSAAPAPPRVWPTFVACALVLPAAGVLGALLAIPFLLARIAADPGALGGIDDDIQARVTKLLVTPGFLAASTALSVLLFGGLAISGAVFSPARAVDRLRLRPTAVPAPRVAVLAACVLATSLGAGAVISLVGGDGKGFMGQLSHAIAEGPLGTKALLFLVVAIDGPPGEELFFRGYVQTRLSQRWGPRVAILVSAALFGLAHGDRWQTPFAFLMGIALGWMTELTGSIRPAVVVHVINNALACASALLVPVLPLLSTPLWNGVELAACCVIGAGAFLYARRAFPGGMTRPPVEPAAPVAKEEAARRRRQWIMAVVSIVVIGGASWVGAVATFGVRLSDALQRHGTERRGVPEDGR